MGRAPRVPVLLLLATLVAVGWVALAPATARASSDVVRRLDVTMAIQTDGSVRVTQTYDYEFASEKAHGIKVKLVTREPWGDDPDKDVVYGISDVTVTSPTGAPTEVNQTQDPSGRYRLRTVRIGSADRTVGERRQTYTIGYTLTGALRTFDGQPQLYWDITSRENPAIDQVRTTVTAPGPVTRSRCLFGGGECPTSTSANTATYSARDVSPGSTFTVVAGLTPGTVLDARPHLEDRAFSSPTMTALDAAGVVDPTGAITVHQSMTYTMPDEGDGTLDLALVSRRPWSSDRDVVPNYRNLRLSIDGTPADTRMRAARGDHSLQFSRLTASFPARPGVRTRQVVLTYVVDGFARPVDDSTVRTSWAVADDIGDLTEGRVHLTLPGPASGATCAIRSRTGTRGFSCGRTTLETSGTSVVALIDEGHVSGVFELAADAPSAVFRLAEPSLTSSVDAGHALAGDVRTWGAGGAAVAMAALGLALGRRGRGRRYVGLPPGVVSVGSRQEPARGAREVPVRFEAPDDLTLLQAGVLMKGRYEPTQLAATLVEQAVQGHLRLASKPLAVERWGPEPGEPDADRSGAGRSGPTASRLGARLWQLASQPNSTHPDSSPEKLPPATASKLVKAARGRAESVLADTSLFRGGGPRWRNRVVLAVVAAGWLGWGFWMRTAIGWSTIVVPLVITVALPLGLRIGRAVGRPPLTAKGTALREQVEGFRLYLSTAEAEQLSFEADRDIFRRYLPWAVLFGLTERWTQVCRELAAVGTIDPPDVTFLNLSDPSALPSAVSSLSTAVQRGGSGFGGGWDSGSGSGSGFSSSSSSGGGGGGSSVSSW